MNQATSALICFVWLLRHYQNVDNKSTFSCHHSLKGKIKESQSAICFLVSKVSDAVLFQCDVDNTVGWLLGTACISNALHCK